MKKNVEILKVKFNVGTLKEVSSYIDNNVKFLKKEYICISNVHTTVMAFESEKYLKIQNSSIFNLTDGKPIQLIAQKKLNEKIERITGPDLMEEIFATSELSGKSHLFYGSTQETLDDLCEKVSKKFPNIIIKAAISPPFKSTPIILSDEEAAEINKYEADYIWIGLGAPKQEEWMFNNSQKLNSLCIGVGAGFDYHAENIKRAPDILQKIALEWVYRLLQDPKRLFKRYAVFNSKFLYYLMKNYF